MSLEGYISMCVILIIYVMRDMRHPKQNLMILIIFLNRCKYLVQNYLALEAEISQL